MTGDLVVMNLIRDRKAKYCRFVDTKKWDDLAALLIAEPKLQFFDVEGSLLYQFESTEKWIELMKGIWTAPTQFIRCTTAKSRSSPTKKLALFGRWRTTSFSLLAKAGRPVSTATATITRLGGWSKGVGA